MSTIYLVRLDCKDCNHLWSDNTATTDGNLDIFFATSSDGGLTFTDPKNISEITGSSDSPQISSDGNNVYVVWQEAPIIGSNDIFFATSSDGGLTFSDPKNISETTGGSGDPQISSSTSQENQNSEIQMTHPQIQMATPTQQTVSAALQQEDSPIITQGTEEDSSALAKIEKLKKQWLELLP